MTDWIPTVTVSSLPDEGGRLFTYLDKRIALFRTPRGVFASDNRCPHQGYALVRGDVKGDVLTCAWHNWKFDLAQGGTCTFGGEAVRTYPVTVIDGLVHVDVQDAPAEIVRPQLFSSLLEAMGEVDLGRVARDTMRLQRIGTPLDEIVRHGVRYAAPRAEYGWDHSLATLADCLRLAAMFEGPLKAMPVVQGLAVASEDQVRRPLRPQPEPIDPVAVYGSLQDGLAAFPRLVDDEQVDDAEALFRGLLAAGATREQLRHALLEAVTDHFLSYGHAMIFCQKAFELVDAIGWSEADTVLAPLVPDITWGTRYDRLPYMRRFLRAWDDAQLDLTGLIARQNGGSLDRAGYRRDLLDGSADDAFSALRTALEAGVRCPGAHRRDLARRIGAPRPVRHRPGHGRYERLGLARRHPHPDLHRCAAMGMVGRSHARGRSRAVPCGVVRAMDRTARREGCGAADRSPRHRRRRGGLHRDRFA